MGVPAATVPTIGTRPAGGSISSAAGFAAGAVCAGFVSVMVRPLRPDFLITPNSSMCFRWKCTVEGDFSPTAAPISRTEGG